MTGITKKPPMDDQQFVTKFTNPLGELRWQPTLPDGQRAWDRYWLRNTWGWRGDVNERVSYGPRLYRSRARAVRVAQRQWVKTVENQWKEA